MNVIVYQHAAGTPGCAIVACAAIPPVDTVEAMQARERAHRRRIASPVDPPKRVVPVDHAAVVAANQARAVSERMARIMAVAVPPGAAAVVVDPATLPASDPATWSIVAGKIVVAAAS